MRIAVASGKGGTGKTSVAVSLALALRDAGRAVQLLDLDVETPNCALLLGGACAVAEEVTVAVPRVDAARCNLCGECAKLCAFGAIAKLNDAVVVFDELCHNCGGCSVVCPERAITELDRAVGVVNVLERDGVTLVEGRLNVGEPRATPVIAAVRQRMAADSDVVIDAPPGTGCPVVAALEGVDLVLVVVEPTPFGVHDARLVVEMLREVGTPLAIVLNRVTDDAALARAWAAERDDAIVAEIPMQTAATAALAGGQPLYTAVPALQPVFAGIVAGLETQVQTCKSW
jgi:MinD superfamily P-loop ATPase